MTTTAYAPLPDEIEQLRRDGFFVTPPLFDEARLETVRSAIERAWHERTQQIARSSERGAASMADFSRVRPELQRLHLDDPILASFCRAPELVRLAAAVIGPDADLSWNQAYTKAPGGDHRTEIPWHQDDWYAEIDGPRYNFWVAISETTIANGTIERARRRDELVPHTWDEPTLFYRCAIDEDEAVPVVMKPGQVFVFDGRLPHRSGVNVSSGTRASYSISFAAPTARLRANGEAFGDRVPVLRAGREVGSLLEEFVRLDEPAGHAAAAVLEEIRARAPKRTTDVRATLDAAREAASCDDAGALEATIGTLLAILPDSEEVLGDLVRSRARVDQLMREVVAVGSSTPELGRLLLERVLSLEPDHAEARAALARLQRESSAKPRIR